MSELDQYAADQQRFIDLIKKYTGIPKSKIVLYLEDNKTENLFYHSDSIKLTPEQNKKLTELSELRRLYQNLNNHEKRYCITSSELAGEYFYNQYSEQKGREIVKCAYLNTQNEIIHTETISKGTINAAMLTPRDIIKRALRYDAKSIILAHNHPSGSVIPSEADISITNRIMQGLELIDINLLDHIIVGENGKFTSLRAEGYIDSRQRSQVTHLREEEKAKSKRKTSNYSLEK